jgi:pantothenate kinase, type III
MLAMDIGNTNVRIAIFNRVGIQRLLVLPAYELEMYALRRTLNECVSEDEDFSPYLWISSVSPQKNTMIASAAEYVGIDYHFIIPANEHIIDNNLTTPETTGVDRLLAALAAREKYFPDVKTGVIVVQCGTAVTVDSLDGNGVFQGGYIMPGPAMWLSGLANAAQIPNLTSIVVDWREDEPGRASRTAVLGGLAVGLPASVRHAIERTEEVLKAGRLAVGKLPLVLTGGWGEVMVQRLGRDCVFDKELVLEGIRMFALRSGRMQ